jgi:WD40 repeat protein
MPRRFLFLFVAPLLLWVPGQQTSLRSAAPPAVVVLPAVRRDAQGDELPAAAVARFGSLRLFHGGSIVSLAFLADGKTLLSSGDGTLRAWETATGKEIPVPVLFPSPTTSFVLSPSAKLLAAVGEDRVLRIGDVRTGRLLREWKVEQNAWALAVSSDDRLVAWTDNSSKIHVRDLETEKEVRVLSGHENSPSLIAFSPDGKTLASLSYHEGLLTWNLATGKRVRRYAPINQRKTLSTSSGLFFAAGGRVLVVAGNDASLVAYEVDALDERWKIEPPGNRCNALALTRDGKILASDADGGAIRLWHADTGKLFRVLGPPQGAPGIGSLAFSADGKTLAIGCHDGRIRLWDAEAGRERLPRHAPGSLALAGFSANGHEVVTLQPSVLKRWSIRTGKSTHEAALPGGSITGAVLSADRQFIAVARADTPVSILSAGSGVERVRSTFTYRRPVLFEFTPDGRQVVGIGAEEPNLIRLFDARKGKELTSFKGSGIDTTMYALAMSRDGRTLFTVGQEEKSLVRWERFSGQRRGAFRIPDPRPQMHSMHGDIIIWRGGGGFRVHQAEASRLPIALSSDNRLLAVCRGELLLLCDLVKERALHVLLGGQQSFSCVAFSPDGRWLAAGSEDRLVRLYDAQTGKLHGTLSGHRGNILQVAFSPESDRLLSTSTDGTVLVWNVADARQLPPPAAKRDPVRSLESLWADLASEDAAIAEKAQRAMEARATEALPFLARNLRPVRPIEPARLSSLILELDSSEQVTRDRASAQLGLLAEQAVPAMRKAVDSPSAEVRKRVKALLDSLDRPVVTGVRARPIRVVELLERLATAPARKLLGELSGGAPEARLTEEARSALERLRGAVPEDKTAP